MEIRGASANRIEGTGARVIRHTTEVGAHTGARRFLSYVGSLAVWLFVAFCAWFLWPSSLGGATTFILVSGRSMEPDYLPGDLLIARAGEPSIGDAIVYRPGGQYGDAKVVHKIVGGDGVSGWEMKGINNDFIDQWKPTNDQVVGLVQVHFPSLGGIGVVLLSPFLWASILIVAVGLLVWPERPDDDEATVTRATDAVLAQRGSR